MGFQLIQKLVTLNDLNRAAAIILRYFTELDSFGDPLR